MNVGEQPSSALAGAREDRGLAALLVEVSLYRLLSTLFRPPSSDFQQQVLALAAPLDDGIRAHVERLVAAVLDDLEREYHELLGAGGPCPTGQTDYAANRYGGKGTLLADLCGFYRAFSFDPHAELRESPDHVAVELAFAAWLRMKQALAVHGGEEESAALCDEAFAKFYDEHLGGFLIGFCQRVEEHVGEGVYLEAVRLTRETGLVPSCKPERSWC